MRPEHCRSRRAMDRPALLLLLLILGGSLNCYVAEQRQESHPNNGAVVVHREEVCVAGLQQVEARYCADLSLKDIGTGEGFLRHLDWLRFENSNTILQGDAVGPLGTRMVLSLKNHVGSGFNDTNLRPSGRSDSITANLARMELLLKEIVGSEAIGWGSSGPLDLDLDATVVSKIKSPFKTMVLLDGRAGLGTELQALVSPFFKDFVPDVNSMGGESGDSTLGLWHWLPASSFVGLDKQDGWPSFFSSLGAPSADPKLERRGRFLPKWLAKRASLMAEELSSSQWQVHQRSLTLVPPRGKRRSLSLTYCESALSSSPPKCTVATRAAETPIVQFDIPEESQLQVKLDSSGLSGCSPLGTIKDNSEELWVLEDIQRTLVGNGAHRMLQSTVTLSKSSGSGQRFQDNCQLRLLERLSTGVFADLFELQSMQRRGGFKEAWIHGDLNVEQPALLSKQSIVVLHVSLRKVNTSGSDGSGSLLQAEVVLPLHARYPPLSVDSHSVVHIPMPHMFMSCQQEEIITPGVEISSKWNQVVTGNKTASTDFAAVLDWMVPAANPADYSFVARCTAIGALTGVLVVFAVSVSTERRV